MIEIFDGRDLEDDVDVSDCLNTYKPDIKGLVARETFVLLYTANEFSICFAGLSSPTCLSSKSELRH